MKIQYCSDLHLEFEQNSKYLSTHPLKVSGDILILSGDIVPLHDEHFKHPFFSFIADHYKEVYWVPGNHEFYHTNLGLYNTSYQIDLRSNIHLINNVTMQIDNTPFIFSTLWSHISKRNERLIERSVSDFSCIELFGKKIKASDFNKLHKDSLNFIKESLNSFPRNPVVVSHHLPSALCNSNEHVGSKINEAFCVDLTHFIETSPARFWIYGHSHFNQKPLQIGNTILLTNQLGYVKNNEHTLFKHNAYFAI